MAVVAPVFMFISSEVKSGSVVVNGLKEFSFISFCGVTINLILVLGFSPTISEASFFAANYGEKFYQRSVVPENFKYKHDIATMSLSHLMSGSQNECVSSFAESRSFNPGDTVVIKNGNSGALAMIDDDGKTATELKYLIRSGVSFFDTNENLTKFDLSKYQVCRDLSREEDFIGF